VLLLVEGVLAELLESLELLEVEEPEVVEGLSPPELFVVSEPVVDDRLSVR
jgi:hypothetical protein